MAKKGAKKNFLWIGGRERAGSGVIAGIAALCVLAIVLAAVLQSSGLTALTGKDAPETDVRIRAFASDNLSRVTESGDAPDWIEVENIGASAVNLERYSLLLESDINDIFSFPKRELLPGEKVTVYASGDTAHRGGELRAPFRLPASGGDTLVLLNPQGKAADAVAMPELRADESYCRASDGSWQVVRGTGAAAESAVVVTADTLEISEVMTGNTLYCADAQGKTYDYVEIHNRSNSPVSLAGWHLADASDSLTDWTFPDVSVAANGYQIVYCSGENRADGVHAPFRLSSAGETVYLTRPDGCTVSKADVPTLQTNQAYSLENGEWSTELPPTPGLENTREAANALNARMFSGLSGVRINEVMASPTEQNNDWIELYNASNAAVDLSGCGLSDDASKPRRYQFPSGTVLQAGAYMGVFCSGTTEKVINGFLNADFSLSIEGGYTVSLSDANGSVRDAMYVPKQYTGVSYGRGADGGMYFFGTGTPGMASSGSTYYGRAAMAAPSVRGGLFSTGDSFSVELTAPQGSRIYYTLDASDPTQASAPYSAPIPVNGTTVLRTRVYRDGYLDSYIDTQSYIFDAQRKNGVYVVSLVSDMKNLSDPETGIMVEGNYQNNKKEWEREASFELFTADGARVVGQGCGISLHGQSSRDLPVKTFNVIARGTYGGKNRFEYPIFHERDYEAYQAVLLRPSGEDYAKSFMRDTMLTSLLDDSCLMYQKWEPAVVYLDGKYYSLMYIRERINKFSICQFEGWEGMEDDLDIVRGNSSTTQGSNETFKALQQKLASMNTNTDEAYRLIDANIDIDNYIEYIAAEIFSGNTDLINVRRYRNAKADGKWRWCIFDLDWAFNLDKDSILDWLDGKGVGVRDATDNSFFVACMKNDTFRDRFLTRFGELMATKFSTENVVNRIERQYNVIADFLPRYAEQWNLSTDRMAKSIKALVEYARTRPNLLINTYTKNALRLSDADMEKYFGEANRKIAEYGQ